jgi:hypothetical protein
MLKKSPRLSINRLHSGGLITNYYCTSSCAHCLYGCSPRWHKDYIDRETLAKNLEKILSLGCTSIHIGGGEPFLDPQGLKMVIETALSLGVRIEYVETNSSWYRDDESARETLKPFKKSGLSALLISMSPFHNEHIPFFKVKGVIGACRAVGINIFTWISEFYQEIEAFDDRTTHSLSEYQRRYGQDYVKRLPSRYWVHFGGRALKTFAPVFGVKPWKEILSSSQAGCIELLDVSHFHFDLFGNYIPGLCSGLAIHRDDLGTMIPPEQYPILHTLFQEGIRGLFDLASGRYDFKPSNGYLSKCHLCFDIRRHMVLEQGIVSRELEPKDFYEQV